MTLHSSDRRSLDSFVILITLLLAAFACPAEGFVLYDQQTNSFPSNHPDLQSNQFQHIIDLSGPCEYKVDDEKNANTCWIPFSYEGQHVVTINKTFNLPDSLRYWSIQLYLPELSYTVQIWINGGFAASFTGSHLGYSSEISQDHLHFGGANTLTLKIDNRLSPTESLPLYPQVLHPQNYGGIFSGMYLRCIPSWSIEDVYADYTLDKDSVLSDISVVAQLSKHAAAGLSPDKIMSKVKLSVEIQDTTGKVFSSGESAEIERKSNEDFQVNLPLSKFSPVLWSVSNPKLYQLSAYLTSGTDTIHIYHRSIGFKSIRFANQSVLLNGHEIKLRGIEYIPESKYGGRVMSRREYEEDLARIKELGINTLRIPFNAPPPELVYLADESGFLLFLENGVNWVPPAILNSTGFRKLAENSYDRFVKSYRANVSVFGWGMGSILDYKSQNTLEFVSWLKNEIKKRDNKPCFIETLDINDLADYPVDFAFQAKPLNDDNSIVLPNTKYRFPVMISRVGYLANRGVTSASQESAAIVKQADYLLGQVKKLDNYDLISGYFVHSFCDYKGAHSLLSQPNGVDPFLYSFGLVKQNREERISFSKLRDIAQAGSSIPLSTHPQTENSSNIFPIAGLAAILLLSAELRRNNIFRQNLKRIFMHPHGFFVDIRYRRFLQASQPILLWLIESLVLALLLASVLYYFRYSFGLDYFLTHFSAVPAVKSYIASVIWDPIRSSCYLTGLFMFLFLLKALFIKFFSIPFRERVDYWQAFNYLLWSCTPLLFLLPLTVIFLRMLSSSQFTFAAYLAIGIGLIWSTGRLLVAVRTGYSATSSKVYGLIFFFGIALITIIVILLNNKLATMSYYEYYQHVLSSH